MKPSFNAEEHIHIARRIEGNGRRFYEWAAQRASDPHAKHLLSDLAAMEAEHERRFAAMKPAMIVGDHADPETDAFLAAWADGSVFRFGADDVPPMTGRETMAEILQTALGLEKETVVFYSGLRSAITAPDDAAALDRIISEELRHVALIGRAIADSK